MVVHIIKFILYCLLFSTIGLPQTLIPVSYFWGTSIQINMRGNTQRLSTYVGRHPYGKHSRLYQSPMLLWGRRHPLRMRQPVSPRWRRSYSLVTPAPITLPMGGRIHRRSHLPKNFHPAIPVTNYITPWIPARKRP